MKNTTRFGILALALAAAAAFVPSSASAAGNIRRMDSTTPYPATAPARIGSEVTFRMVLDNNTKSAPYDLPFRLLYQGFNGEALDFIMNPPQIAIQVSGATHWATLKNIGAYEKADGTKSTQLTALDFSYTVKPGDMASPLLVQANDVGSSYTFLNVGAAALWRICDTNDTPADADFSFGGKADAPDSVAANANYNLASQTDGDGAVYIETMDFDVNVTDAGYWREIPATTEIATPRILIPGGATTNGTVYLWISDATGKAIVSDVTFGSTMKTQKNDFGQDVHPVTFTTGDEEVTFSLYGKTDGAEAIVYMSAEPQNTFATGGYLVSNFVYRTVKVTTAPEPAIKFKLDHASVTCGTNWTEQAAILTAYIEPAQTLPEDLTVELNMKSGTITAAQLFATNSIRVSDVALGTPSYLNTSTTVTIKKGSSSGEAYIFALGAENDSITFTPSYPASMASLVSSLNLRLPVAGDGCELKINPSAPVIQVLDSDAKEVVPPVFALTEKRPYTFYLALADGYRCSQCTTMAGYPGYTVKWDRESDKAATAINPQTFTNIIPKTVSGRLVLPVTVNYPYSGSFTNTKIRVTNPDGGFTELSPVGDDRISVNVAAAMKAYATPDHADKTYAEGETARISFTLSEAYVDLEGNYLYAFLEPLNEDATNCTSSSQWIYDADENPGTAGIMIDGTASTGYATVTLTDGFDKSRTCTPIFGVHFCTTQTYDPKTEVTDYSISSLSLAVTNTYPYALRMVSGEDIVSQNNGRFETPVVMDVDNKFTLVVNDRSTTDLAIGETEQNKQIAVRWGFKGATDKKWTYIWKFGLDEDASTSASYAFTEPNTSNNVVKVTIIDKDMRESGDITWVVDDTYEEGGYYKVKTSFDIESFPTFSAYVEVTDQPMVLVQPSKDYFEEQDFFDGSAYFTVSLSETADKALEVTLFIERLKTIPAGTANPGILMPEDGYPDGAVIKAKHVFQKGKGKYGSTTAWKVTLDDLDGTLLSKNNNSCYKIYAKVTSAVNIVPNGGTTPYCDIYGYQTLSPFQVWNTAPELMDGTSVAGFDPNTETNRYTVERNKPITAQWTVHDIPADLTNNLAVTISYGTQSTVTNYTSASTVDELGQTVTGSFSFAFADAGDYTVSIKAADKDNGYVIQYWYFTVAASKNVFLRALVQDGANIQSDTAAKPYTSAQASGKGSGRVWAGAGADTGYLYAINLFKHQWIYKPSARTSTFFAKGYQVGDVEGSLSPYDQDIDPSGNKYDSGAHYAYPDGTYDSFFYRYVVNVASENGAWASTLRSPQPQYGKAAVPAEGSVTLAEEDDDETKSYADIMVEAIFSKELYAADNLGDINRDGVPDYYATSYNVSDSSADTSSASTDSTTTETSTDTDLNNVSAANPDEDYLPAAASASDPLHPGTRGWGPGRAFGFKLEVRGIGEGLNEAGISEYDLTPAETFALLKDYADAGHTVTGAWAAVYAAATNWATSAKWSLERRLDPTTADTDSDGLDDGTEYFFWYYATAGRTAADGSWARLTGRRFTLDRPGQGEDIPSWVISQAFDPLAARGSDRVTVTDPVSKKSWSYNANDFDDDGLGDLEEIALGLNPADFDSDQDGISDLWELMNGLDPLDATDADKNPDRDFMARYDTEKPYRTIFFSNGSAFALEKADNAMTLQPLDDTYPSTNACYSTVASGVTYYIAGTNAEPDTVVRNGSTYLVRDTAAYVQLAWEGELAEVPDPNPPVKYFLGKPVTLPAGTLLTASGEEKKIFNETTAGFCGVASSMLIHLMAPFDIDQDTNPEPAGIRVYRYGTDADALIVPCKAIINDNAEYEDYLPKEDNYGMDMAVWEIVEDKPLTLLHNQVLAGSNFGLTFDPRTAWSKNSAGYVAKRWITPDTVTGKTAGLAVNTVPFSNLHEYMLLQYRYMSEVQFGGLDLAADKALLNGNSLDLEAHLKANTTLPNIPFDASASTTSSSNVTTSAYANTIHGADTDEDGIPDGWELYVNINPNDPTDATWKDTWAKDEPTESSQLCFLEEYAGLDSCAAYAPTDDDADYPECTTITANSPTQDASPNAGWLNKFFPSNPYAPDTDGDGLDDSEEREAFKFGDPEDNGTSICIRGAGLNPCAVDTDGDHLPDAWEWEFQGKVWDGSTELDAALAFNGSAFVTNQVTDTQTAIIVGGMDGTYLGDQNLDFDHDGLLNYQEYLVQALRHLRYDDIETPLMGRELNWTPADANPQLMEMPFQGFLPMQTMDGEAFYELCLKKGFTGISAYSYSKLGYFALPPCYWDPSYLAGYKVMLRPMGVGRTVTPDTVDSARMVAERYEKGDKLLKTIPLTGTGFQKTSYVSTDPRLPDTDNDGMDDYYELFHGLNPILGTSDQPMDARDNNSANWEFYDVIARSYNNGVNAWNNGWTIWNARLFDEPSVRFDAMRFPWMIGTPECDADGDGLRNSEEMIKANAVAPQPSHTDPTPLWMTDSSSTNYASYVAQYYAANPYVAEGGADVFFQNWDWSILHEGSMGWNGYTRRWMFTFEENEGYDSDHDFKSDSVELTKTVENASDPLDQGDPARRQALYFPGKAVPGAAITARGTCASARASEAELLREFTVECWIRPDVAASGEEQVILERASNYGPSTLSNNVSVMTANFRLGLDAAGFPFAEFTGTTGAGAVSRIVSVKAATDATWTHLAATFDGSTFALYMNGSALPVATATGVGIIPANGVTIVTMASSTSFAEQAGMTGYATVPTATILGAHAVDANPLTLDGATTWNDFSSFYAGYVSEVRVWDRARTSTQIAANYKTAFTATDISDLRNEFYLAWKAANMVSASLPAQLVQHYNFSGLPNAPWASYVAVEPPAFTEKVLDNVRIEGGKVPGGLVCGWWSQLDSKVRSRVYTMAEIVPWVHNTCRHLAYLDGSAPDSYYWSTAASGNVAGQNDYPNTYNPYSYVNFIYERYWRYVMEANMSADGLAQAWLFDIRTYGFPGTEDIVPLGSAFAQRGTDYWDGQGAMDAWTATGHDADGDALPDWYEQYVQAKYTATDGTALGAAVAWDQTILRNGEKMTVSEAYALDLAAGLLPNGATVAQYQDTAKDANGMLLWWKRLYGVSNYEAFDDPDYDGLSIYAEYLSSQGDYPYGVTNGFWKLNPMKAVTASGLAGQVVPDYFLPGPTSGLYAGVDVHGFNRYFDAYSYLGEIFADHDFMEDVWERQYALGYANAEKYDPSADTDEDGWSNWAECRAYYWCGTYVADMIERYLDGEQLMECHPQPALGIRVTYHGDQDIAGAGLVVRTFTGDSTRMDATFTVAGGDTSGGSEQIVGGYFKDAVLRGTLHPGCIVPSIGYFEKARLTSENRVTWSYAWYVEHGYWSYSWTTRTGTLSEYLQALVHYPHITLESTAVEWEQIATTSSDAMGDSGQILYGGTNSSVRTQIGTINYRTGEYALDLAKLAEVDSDLEDSLFRVSYSYRIGQNWPQTLYLSKPDSGLVKEGANTIEAFIDLDGDGAYTAGEPFGVVQNVQVGWHKTPVTVIELTDTSTVVPRYDISSGSSDRTALKGTYGGVTSASSEESAAQEGASAEASSGSGAESSSGEIAKTIRIVRRSINGNAAPERVLMNKKFVLDDRAYIHEGDVLATDKPDIDWRWLVGDAEKLGISADGISAVSYDIEEIGTLEDGSTTNVTLATFVNTYKLGRAVPKAVSPIASAPVYSAAPAFTWACDDTTMTAFRLEVSDVNGTVVYDSGYQRVPGRTGTTAGSYTYTFTPPIYADAPVTTNGAPVLVSGQNYQWRVALYNAKYRADAESAWTAWTPFQVDVANVNRHPAQLTGYGLCGAAVRYYGPAQTNDLTGLIVVEAFENADFTGQPAAQARVDLTDGLLSSLTDASTVNVTLPGLEPGDWYLRAYIDANNNGKRDSWESWGYANQVGQNREDIYTPMAVTVENSLTKVPSVTVYIEDADVNQNEIPDCLEALTTSDLVTDADNDGLSDDDETVVGTSPNNWDSDGDGIPDGWEKKYINGDLDADDCPEYASGDMMAYEEFAAKLVTIDDGSQYLLADGADVPLVGDLARKSAYTAWYSYGVKSDAVMLYGLGTNVLVNSTTARITGIEDVTAVRVHAQVFAKYGFEAGVATLEDTTGHSKKFTALDKYLVCRYLEALGLADESAMNADGLNYTVGATAGSKWSQWTCNPESVDGNNDGVADGWALYVMFGADDLSVAQTWTAAKFSPWGTANDARQKVPAGALTWVQKYAEGAHAMNPYATDTDKDGVTDKDTYNYQLWDPFGDIDSDGLCNWTEYAIQKTTGEPTLQADTLFTDGQVPDYFRYSKLAPKYCLGFKYADHDFVEDWWERAQGTDVANAAKYDPLTDLNQNGWSLWSEARAQQDEASWTQTGTASNTTTVTFSKGDAKLSYFLATNKAEVVSVERQYAQAVAARSGGGEGTVIVQYAPGDWVSDSYELVYSADWTAVRYTLVSLDPVKEYTGVPVPTIDLTLWGVTAASASADSSNTTVGVTLKVYRGRDLAAPYATFAVEGTPVNGVLHATVAGEGLVEGLNTFVVESGDACGWAAAKVGYHGAKLAFGLAKATDFLGADVAAYGDESRVAIRRTKVNGTAVTARTVWSGYADEYVKAADILKNGVYDLDWKNLASDVRTMDIGTVEYEVVVTAAATNGTGTTTTTSVGTFTRTFPSVRPQAVLVGPTAYQDNTVRTAQPTFTFSGLDGMTAFRLEIAAATNEAALWSTTALLPVANANGVYTYTAPITIGEELADASNYVWRVSGLSAKWPAAGTWSAWGAFKTAIDSTKFETGYGKLGVEVRYYGAATNAATDVVVAVYDSPDFAGTPVAAKHLAVTDFATLAVVKDEKTYLEPTANVTFDGLAIGSYYVLAFNDRNGNGRRDAWESWGYVNKMFTFENNAVEPDLYTPVSIAVTTGRASAPAAVLFMEDTDKNDNAVPDCLEAEYLLWDDADADGLSDEDEDAAGTDAGDPDTDDDGIPDGAEEAMGTDPLDGDDAGFAADGDVMAYAETNVLFVAIGASTDESTWTWYAVTDLAQEAAKLRDGDLALGTPAASLTSLHEIYEYGAGYGLGKAVAVTEGAVRATEAGVVKLVHAQVYDAYGYNQLTANAQAYAAGTAVNTKPFTALDKYLVCRYLEAIGVAGVSEEKMLGTADWSLLLKAGVVDLDGDDVADGWELYVMFGSQYATLGSLDDAKVSPFTAADGLAAAPGDAKLTLVQEYDGGHFPTDPWQTDSDHDGISDADAYNFHLKGDNYRGDADHDGLPNFVEFMVTRGFANNADVSFPTVDADRMMTSGKAWGGTQVVPDYFLRVGKLYLGEMFTDHDFIESHLESSNEVQQLVGKLDPYAYDATGDLDGDGWSNFAEIRAFLAGGTMEVDRGVVTNWVSRENVSEADILSIASETEAAGLQYQSWIVGDHYAVSYQQVTNLKETVSGYQGVPTPEVTLDVTYTGKQTVSGYVVKAYQGTATLTAPDATWTGVTKSSDGKLHLTAPTSGALKEGAHTFVVYATVASTSTTTESSSSSESASSSDAWTPGAPYGVVAGVDVGWKQASARVEITDTNPSVIRIDLANALADNSFAGQVQYNDRGVNGMQSNINKGTAPSQSTLARTVNDPVRVRVVRYEADGISVYPTYKINYTVWNVVVDKYVDLSLNGVLTEANLLIPDGKMDLDWGSVATAGAVVKETNVTNMSYRVFVGDDVEGVFATYGSTNGLLATAFVNRFESGTAQTLASPDMSATVTAGNPTFKWTHPNTIGKAYPAFELRVYTKGGELVYDTGARRAPAKDANGVYAFTPEDLHVGEATMAGKVFANNADYYWTVSMLDAKFTTPNANETKVYFRTAVNSVGGVLSEEGSISVGVKYFGPVTVSADTAALANLIRVEAFSSPDFAGAPAAATYAKNVDALAATDQVVLNAQLEGLAAGTWYVRAYIDSNGNRALDADETWGYGNFVGTDTADLYTPRGYTIKLGSTLMPEAVVYLEDADADNNGLPDAWTGTQTTTGASGAATVTVLDNTAETFSIFKNFDAGVLELPYVNLLTQLSNDASLSALRLDYALAMAGTSLENSLTPTVTITSFTLDDGIALRVDMPTTLDAATLKATQIKDVSVTVTLTLKTTASLDDAWTTVKTVTDTFKVNTVNGTLDAAQLEALNAQIRAEVAKSPAAFFKVEASIQ